MMDGYSGCVQVYKCNNINNKVDFIIMDLFTDKGRLLFVFNLKIRYRSLMSQVLDHASHMDSPVKLKAH